MQNLDAENSFEKQLTSIIEEYIFNVQEELRHLWNSWEIDINNKEVHEVIGAVIARQISLATTFIVSTNNWNNELAPIILRSMTDNYINLAWLLQEPLERTQKFISFGLGQEKLVMEHRKKQLEEEGINAEDDPAVNAMKQWINFQQYDFLTLIDIGSWSKVSVYDMALQAGCKDFYNYVYQPLSSATHNMWNHIGKHNVKMSDDPLHKFLLTPKMLEPEVKFIYPTLAVKYVEKCLTEFHQKFNIQRNTTISADIFYNRFEKLSEDFNFPI